MIKTATTDFWMKLLDNFLRDLFVCIIYLRNGKQIFDYPVLCILTRFWVLAPECLSKSIRNTTKRQNVLEVHWNFIEKGENNKKLFSAFESLLPNAG